MRLVLIDLSGVSEYAIADACFSLSVGSFTSPYRFNTATM